MESSESNNSVRSAASSVLSQRNRIKRRNEGRRANAKKRRSSVAWADRGRTVGRTDGRTDEGESALAGEKAGKKGWKERGRGENKREREGGPQNDQAHLYSDGAAAIVTSHVIGWKNRRWNTTEREREESLVQCPAAPSN